MMRTINRLLSASLYIGLLGNSFSQERIQLEDDISRSELMNYSEKLQPGKRLPRKEFLFPDNAENTAAYGIDVSHYQGEIDWEKVFNKSVRYAYIKATQGSKYYDNRFAENWNAVGKQALINPAIRRGAYHFMTADDDPSSQASNFLKTVVDRNRQDFPPCLDLEWDFIRDKGKNVLDGHGRPIDRWAALSSDEIVRRVDIWMTKVAAEYGQTPIIYTNINWMKQRLGNNNGLQKYQLHMSQYLDKGVSLKSPRRPKDSNWIFWQFTDQGKVPGGIKNFVDVSIFNGKPDQLTKR